MFRPKFVNEVTSQKKYAKTAKESIQSQLYSTFSAEWF